MSNLPSPVPVTDPGPHLIDGAITTQFNKLVSALGTAGSFVANGATAVVVNNPAVTATSSITFTLAAVGGAVGAYPVIKTITPGVGFTVAATAGDTSTYNYQLIG